MVVKYCSNREEADKYSADILTSAINRMIEEKGIAILGVPGGRNVGGIFSELATKKIDWKKVQLFMIDERLVELTDPESNFSLVKEHLLSKCPIPDENVHPFILENTKDYGIQTYKQELKKYGEQYDVLILSAGEDGHVGGIFPNYTSYDSAEEYFTFVEDAPKPPPKRMSMSRKHILRAKVAIVVFFGESKDDALTNFIDVNIQIRNCPAKLVKRLPKWCAVTDL